MANQPLGLCDCGIAQNLVSGEDLHRLTSNNGHANHDEGANNNFRKGWFPMCHDHNFGQGRVHWTEQNQGLRILECEPPEGESHSE